MQAPDDLDLAAAVEAPERAPRVRLLADWDRDQSFDHPLTDLSTVVDEISVERALTGDLPPETTLIEGYATAKLTARVSGHRPDDPRDVARMLSPIRADSPLFGKPIVDVPVRCDLGLTTPAGERMLRQFTGTVRRLDVTSATRTVELEALDPAEQLRAPVTLPLYAERVDTYYSYTTRYHAYTNTQWLVDFCLRRNGIYFSPPPRPTTIWAVTGHGSLAPDIGNNAQLAAESFVAPDTPLFVPGRYGLAANGGPDLYAEATYNSAVSGYDMRTPHTLELLVKAGGSNTFHARSNGSLLTVRSRFATGAGHSVEIAISPTGQLLGRIYTTTSVQGSFSGPSITGPAAWHSVGLWLWVNQQSRIITYAWQLDGVTTPIQTAQGNALVSFDANPRAEVKVALSLPVQCLQISTGPPTGPPANWGAVHTSQADLDTGLNWLTGLPDVHNADSWDIIRQAVAAEYGLVGFNEIGRFFFRTRTSAQTATDTAAVGRTLTAAVSLADLRVSTSIDSVRNQITAAITPRLEVSSPVTVWQTTAPDEYIVAENTTVRVLVTMPHRVKTSYATLTNVPIANWTDTAPASGFCPISTAGSYIPSGVFITVEHEDDEYSFYLRIRNTSTLPIMFATGTRPALRVAGIDSIEIPPIQHSRTNPASATTWGSRVLTLPDNPFRQRIDTADTVSALLLADLANPVPVLDDIPVTGDPRTQLADLVTLHDPDGLGGPIQGSVIGIRRTLSDTSGLADTLTIRARRLSG
ncbi:hypothetical protein JOF56_000883 [Kibdelosporangium banguiense]|uniref:Minor tail protein n=1 Tax=Kibdelosporangium banguiense TaxID=1365924 RepID=A0ABS4T9G6_9PSEU|nr:hypothetical protein [Kibdelosporangium banguiense]MBP2320498.1 hypothetical protein [Kibdelosporangium banguiense]